MQQETPTQLPDQMSPSRQSCPQPGSALNPPCEAETQPPEPQHEAATSQEALEQQATKEKPERCQVPRFRAVVESRAFKNILVDEMDMMMSRAATLIQANWRGYQLRQKLISQMMAAKAIQEAWRRFSTKRILHSGKGPKKEVEDDRDIPYHPPQQVRFQQQLPEGQKPFSQSLPQTIMVNKETQFPSSDSLVPCTSQQAMQKSLAVPGPLEPSMASSYMLGTPNIAFFPHQTVAIRLPCPMHIDNKRQHPCMLTKTIRSSCLVHIEGDMVKDRHLTTRPHKAGTMEPALSGTCDQVGSGSLKTQTQAHVEAEASRPPAQVCLVPMMALTPPQTRKAVVTTKIPSQTCPATVITKIPPQTCTVSMKTKIPPQACMMPPTTKTSSQARPVAAMAYIPPQTHPAATTTKTPPQTRPACTMTKTPPQICSVAAMARIPSQTYPMAKTPPQARLATMITRTPAQIRSVATLLKTFCLSPATTGNLKAPPEASVASEMPKSLSHEHQNAANVKATFMEKQVDTTLKVSSQLYMTAEKAKCLSQEVRAPKALAGPHWEAEKNKICPQRQMKMEVASKTSVDMGMARTLSWAKVVKDKSKTQTQAQEKKETVRVLPQACPPTEVVVTPCQAQPTTMLTKTQCQAHLPTSLAKTLSKTLSKALSQTQQVAELPKAQFQVQSPAGLTKTQSQKMVKLTSTQWQGQTPTGLAKGQSQVQQVARLTNMQVQQQVPAGLTKAQPQTQVVTRQSKVQVQAQMPTVLTRTESQAQQVVQRTRTQCQAQMTTGMNKSQSQTQVVTGLTKTQVQARTPNALTKGQSQAQRVAELTRIQCQREMPTGLARTLSQDQLVSELTKVHFQAQMPASPTKTELQAQQISRLTKTLSQARLATETTKPLSPAHHAADLSKTQSQPQLAGCKAATQTCHSVCALGPLPQAKLDDRLTQIPAPSLPLGKSAQGLRPPGPDTQDMLMPLLAGYPSCNIESWGDGGAARAPPPTHSQPALCLEEAAASQLASLYTELTTMLGSQEDLRSLLCKALSQGEVRAALTQVLSKEVLGTTVAKALPQGMLGAVLAKALSWSELGVAVSRALSRTELRAELARAVQGRLADVLSKTLTEDERAALSQALCQGELGAVLSTSLSQTVALRTAAMFPKAAVKTAGSSLRAGPGTVEVDCRGTPSGVWKPTLASKVRVPCDGAWEEMGDGATLGRSPCLLGVSMGGSLTSREITTHHQCSLILDLNSQPPWEVRAGSHPSSLSLSQVVSGDKASTVSCMGPNLPQLPHLQPSPSLWPPLIANGIGPSTSRPSVTGGTTPNSHKPHMVSKVAPCAWLSPGATQRVSGKLPSSLGSGGAAQFHQSSVTCSGSACWCQVSEIRRAPSGMHRSSMGRGLGPGSQPQNHKQASVGPRDLPGKGTSNSSSATMASKVSHTNPQAARGPLPVSIPSKTQSCLVTQVNPNLFQAPKGLSQTPITVQESTRPWVSTSAMSQPQESTTGDQMPMFNRLVIPSADTGLARSFCQGSMVRGMVLSNSQSSLQSSSSVRLSTMSVASLNGIDLVEESREGTLEGDLQTGPLLPGEERGSHQGPGKIEEASRTQPGHTPMSPCQPATASELVPILHHGSVTSHMSFGVHWGLESDTDVSLDPGSNDTLKSLSQASVRTGLVRSLSLEDVTLHHQASRGQASVISRLAPSLSYLSMAIGVAPSLSHPSAASEVAPNLAQSSADNRVAPSLSHPSVASEVAPNLAQSSADNRVAPSLSHPSAASGVAPSLTQPSVASRVTPSLSHPSVASGVTPSLSQPSAASGVVPSLAQSSADNRVAPGFSHPSAASGVAPSVVQPSADNKVAPSFSHPSAASGVAPSLDQSSPDNRVAPSLSHPSAASGVAPSLVQSSAANRVAPNLSHPSAASGVLPSLAQPTADNRVAPSFICPSVASGVAPNKSQSSAANRVAPNLSHPSVVSGVAPSLAQSSADNRVAPGLSHPSAASGVAPSVVQPSADNKVAPSLSHPSAASGVAPSLAQPSADNRVAPNLSHPSAASGVAPSVFQPSADNKVAPNLSHPSVVSGVAPSLAQPSADNRVAPSFIHPSVASGVAPNITQSSAANRVAPNLSHPSVASRVVPSLAQSSVANRVAPNLTQSSAANRVAPSLSYPSVSSGVAPSLAQSSVADRVAPSFMHPSVASGVTPNITQSSAANRVAPSLSHPSTASGVAPSLAQSSLANRVAPNIYQPSVVSRVPPNLAQSSLANRVAPNLSHPSLASGVAPCLSHPSAASEVAPSLASVARRVAPSLSQPSVAGRVVPGLAQSSAANMVAPSLASVAKRVAPSLSQPSVRSGMSYGLDQPNLTSRIDSNIHPSKVNAIASSLHQPSMVLGVTPGKRYPSAASEGWAWSQRSLDSWVDPNQDPLMDNGVASSLQHPKFSEVYHSVSQPSPVTVSTPNLYQASVVNGVPAGLSQGINISQGDLFRGIAPSMAQGSMPANMAPNRSQGTMATTMTPNTSRRSVAAGMGQSQSHIAAGVAPNMSQGTTTGGMALNMSQGIVSASMTPNMSRRSVATVMGQCQSLVAAGVAPSMSRGTMAAGMALNISQGTMTASMTPNMSHRSVATGMGQSQSHVVGGVAPVASWVSVADVPLIHEQASVALSFSQPSLPNRLAESLSKGSLPSVNSSTSHLSVDLPASLDYQHPSVAIVITPGYQQTNVLTQESMMGTASDLVPDSVASRSVTAMVPGTVASGVIPKHAPGSVMRGMCQNLSPECMINGTAKTLSPGYVASGMAQTIPPGSVASGMAQTIPPGSVASGMTQTLPPAYVASGVHQTILPGSVASGMTQTLPPAYAASGMAQTIPPGSVASGMAQTLPPAYVASGVHQIISPGSVASGVAQTLSPAYVASGMAQTLPPAYVASGVSQTIPPGSMASGVAQTLPPAYVASGMAQTIPPGSVASGVAQTLSPGYVASGMTPGLIAASVNGRKRQSLPLGPMNSMTAPNLPRGSVISGMPLNVPRSSMATVGTSGVTPESIDGGLNQSLVLGPTASVTPVHVGSLLIGITPRPYHVSLAGEESLTPFQASHAANTAQVHPQTSEASSIARKPRRVPTVLSRASQMDQAVRMMPSEAAESQATLNSGVLDEVSSQMSESSEESNDFNSKSLVLEATPWMDQEPMRPDMDDYHQPLLEEGNANEPQMPLWGEVATSYTKSVASGVAQTLPPGSIDSTLARTLPPDSVANDVAPSPPPGSVTSTRTLPLGSMASGMAQTLPPGSVASGIAPTPSEAPHLAKHFMAGSTTPTLQPRSAASRGTPSKGLSLYTRSVDSRVMNQSLGVSGVPSDLPMVPQSHSQATPFTTTPRSPQMAHGSSLAPSKPPGSMAQIGSPSLSRVPRASTVASHMLQQPSSTSGAVSSQFQMGTESGTSPSAVVGDVAHSSCRESLGPRKSFRSIHGSIVSEMLDGSLARLVPPHQLQENHPLSTQPGPKHPVDTLHSGIIRTSDGAHGTTIPRIRPGVRRVSLGYESSPSGSLRPLFDSVSLLQSQDSHSSVAPKSSDHLSLTPTVLQGLPDTDVAGGQPWNAPVPNVVAGPRDSTAGPRSMWQPAGGTGPWDATVADSRKSGELLASEQTVEELIIHAVVIIQAHVRGYLVRRTVKLWHRCATVIQAVWRGYVVRKQLARMHMATRIIQAHWRGYHTRQTHCQQMLQPATWAMLGDSSRTSLEHRCFQSCQPRSCALCQTLSPGLGDPPSVVLLVGSSPRTCHMCGQTMLTRVVQGTGQGAHHQESAASRRAHGAQLAHCSPQLPHHHYQKAAITIQSAWRGFLTRRHLRQQQLAARRVQASWRGHFTRTCLTNDMLLGPGMAWDSPEHTQWPPGGI